MFQNLNPLDKSTATLEILIMLLVAFLIGFIIAWLLRRNRNTNDNSKVVLHEDCEARVEGLKSQLSLTHDAKNKLASEINELKSSLRMTTDLKDEFLPILEISDADNASASRLGFAAAASKDKDDLTRISGVGPFIEKKLNSLGIYTFEQIISFSDETIDKVTEAIEFFPGRIKRDNWVNQAKELNSNK